MRVLWRPLLAGLTLLITAALIGLILGSVLREGQRDDTADLLEQIAQLEEQNAVEVQDHREANQRDHDCIVALALLLADPKRDRTVPPPLPAGCARAPAAGNQPSPAASP